LSNVGQKCFGIYFVRLILIKGSAISNFPGPNALIRLRPEDVGYDVEHGDLSSRINPSMIASFSPSYSSQPDLNDSESTDPLMNMLLRLQEAANSSSKLTAPKPSESTGDANGKVPTSQQS
jgi:hypothetical protein